MIFVNPIVRVLYLIIGLVSVEAIQVNHCHLHYCDDLMMNCGFGFELAKLRICDSLVGEMMRAIAACDLSFVQCFHGPHFPHDTNGCYLVAEQGCPTWPLAVFRTIAATSTEMRSWHSQQLLCLAWRQPHC